MGKKYIVILKESVQKQIRKLPVVYLNKIRNAIFALEDNPRPLGVIKLKGGANDYRIRVGIYRIVYSIQDDLLTVFIFDVGHRGQIYR